MKIISAKKYLLGVFVLPVLFSGTTIAAEESSEAFDYEAVDMPEGILEKPEGYGVDGRGDVVRNSTDLCWRTGYWTPAMATLECDPDLVPKPEIVVAEPEPAPAPPPPEPRTVTFSADALFDFDSDKLKPAGKQALDEFANELVRLKYDLILAIGYADRIGNPDYNQKLSLRRAEAVKNHLVTVDGIEPSRVFAEGRGETNPVTGDNCKGQRGQALKDCLAPDRRVEVEVTGSVQP